MLVERHSPSARFQVSLLFTLIVSCSTTTFYQRASSVGVVEYVTLAAACLTWCKINELDHAIQNNYFFRSD